MQVHINAEICVMGKTFCQFFSQCQSASECEIVFTRKIEDESNKTRIPIRFFAAPPKHCFKPK